MLLVITSKRLVGKVAGSDEPLNKNPNFVNNINKVGKTFANSMDKKPEDEISIKTASSNQEASMDKEENYFLKLRDSKLT